MNDEVAPKGGIPGYSYISDRGTKVDVAARREGERLPTDPIPNSILEQLRLERDASVSAGLPTKYNQQTLVGNISGAGNRHVIEDTPSTRRPINFPSFLDDFGAGTLTVQTGPFSGGYLGVVENVSTITLDERYFLIQDNGGGEVLISLNTTECS